MKSYSLTVSTPLGAAYEGSVESIILRSTEGDLAILAGHAPIMARIVPGSLKITEEGGSVIHATIDGGLLTVSKDDGVVLLCGSMNRE